MAREIARRDLLSPSLNIRNWPFPYLSFSPIVVSRPSAVRVPETAVACSTLRDPGCRDLADAENSQITTKFTITTDRLRYHRALL